MNGGWAVDVVCNYYFDDPDAHVPDFLRNFITNKIGADEASVFDFTPESFMERLDGAQIQHAFLIAVRAGSRFSTVKRHVPYQSVAAMVERFPERFSGLAGIDPTSGMSGVRDLESAVVDHGFVGAHLYPHWFEMAPDHRRFYPFYTKCIELDIPIQIQVGHCLRYSDERPLPSVGRPSAIDTIACDLPELKIVGIHIGWPWTEEMIAVAYKHPNVYIGSDAYAPKHWPESFVRYIDSWGSRKVLFGTDFPVIDPERARREIDTLPIRSESVRRLLRGNAIELYGLDLPDAPR